MVEQKGADPGSLCDGCEGFLRFWWQFWGLLFAVYVGVEICGDPRLWRGEGGLSWPPQYANWLRSRRRATCGYGFVSFVKECGDDFFFLCFGGTAGVGRK